MGDGDAREFLAILERFLLYLCLPLGYDGLAVLDVVAVFFVSCHDSGYLELEATVNLSASFVPNYRDFLGSCTFYKFAAFIDIL